MRTTKTIRGSHRRRCGGALLLALIAALAVAIFAAGVLQLTSTYTRRQVRDEHETRAFYLAEAGLSEAYHGLTTGHTGAIGSETEPVRSGDGLLWVEATEETDGLVRLECTALAGVGSSTLALTVRRSERPAGIFSDGDLVLTSPVLVDGYDSETAPYEEQVVDVLARKEYETITSFPAAKYINQGWSTEPGTIVFISPTYYEFLYEEGNQVFLGEIGPTLPGAGSDGNSITLIADTGGGLVYSDVDPSLGAPATSVAAPDLGVHTSGGGLLATNGSVRIETPSAIYGDIVHGPDGSITLAEGSWVAGATVERSAPLELPSVQLPSITMVSPLEHSSAVPRVVPPGEAGFEALHVLPGGEVVLRGPSTLLVGRLLVDELGILEIDNLDGRVDLYVTQEVNLALDGTLRVLSNDPAQLTLQVSGSGTPVRLASSAQFRGLIYAPQAAVSVSEPFEVFGALIAGTLALDGTVRLHFDSGVAGASGPVSIPRLVSWEVTEVPAAARNISAVEYLRRLEQGNQDPGLPAEALESASWIVNFKYRDAQNRVTQFDGPFVLMPLSEASSVETFHIGAPPQVELASPWLMDIDYVSKSSGTAAYSGPVGNFPSWDVDDISRITLSPPPELADQGWQVTTLQRTP